MVGQQGCEEGCAAGDTALQPRSSIPNCYAPESSHEEPLSGPRERKRESALVFTVIPRSNNQLKLHLAHRDHPRTSAPLFPLLLIQDVDV